MRPIVSLGTGHSAEVSQLPLLSVFHLTPTISLDEKDTLIFTSRHAIAALTPLAPHWIRHQAVTVGQQTAAALYAAGGTLLFAGDRGARDLGEHLAAHFPDRRFFYPRARVPAFDLTGFLRSRHIPIREAVVYETRCLETPAFTPPPHAVIIFTSPSIVQCFFDHFSWQDDWDAVAIGTTTQNAFPKGVTPHLALRPDMAAAIETAKGLSL